MSSLDNEIQNGLNDLVGLMAAQTALSASRQINQTDTLYIDNRWYLISNNRQLLAQSYVEHGIIQTLIDQPVDDAFRSGFKIKTDQLEPDQLEELETYLEQEKVIDSLKQALKWARLFGGGGILLITSSDSRKPLDINSFNENTKIEFRAVDMWELYNEQLNTGMQEAKLKKEDGFYNVNGVPFHPSRVYCIKGKEAPSFIRPRLRGWGMSELERLVRSLNQYLKNQDLIFELLDEAKIDIFKMEGYNSSLLTSGGTNAVANRIQNANMIKNYQNALTMDVADEYEQKQMAFSGLAEILIQIRQGIAADLKMPVTKLFGISAAGFNSGEDDIENYNSMIESEIRGKCKFIVVDMIKIACQKLFQYVPDDLKIEFNPLRILSAKEEEEVKDRQFNRVINAYASGLMTAEEAKQAINKDNLMAIKIDDTIEALQPLDIGVSESTNEA